MARTLGIDLAAAPERTAVCAVEWTPGAAHARALDAGSDGALRELLAQPWDKVGLDCPLGWPTPFVEAVSAHLRGQPWTGVERRQLVFRRTDNHLIEHKLVGRPPLSVSTDRIGVVALRSAALLDPAMPRDGSAAVAEVYPAAALRHWFGPSTGSYKRRNDHAAVGARLDALLAAAPWLQLDSPADYAAGHDLFDALICALIARAVQLGLTTRPDDADADAARVEGWIHVPTCELAQLVTSLPPKRAQARHRKTAT